ncbi:MAG: IclR family transcriptional regulator [Betaproteobacteria bacterium]
MAKPAEARSSQPTVTALLRGLEVLRCFDYARKSLGSSEIARLTGLPQPTVWRLCRTLEREGYLVAEGDGSRFRPGLAVLTLGYAALSTLDLGELVRPQLEAIADKFMGATGLVTRDRNAMLFLLRCEGKNAYLNVTLRAGSTIPIAHSGVGWAYLAGLDEPRREALVADIRRREPDLWRRAERPFRKALEEYARTGAILNVDTFFNGLCTVSLPIGGHASGLDESKLYVIYVSCLTSVLNTDKLRREAGQALKDVARRLAPVLAGGAMRAAPVRRR